MMEKTFLKDTFVSKTLFGDDFVWGVSASAAQTEGNGIGDGKGISIWDAFAKQKKKTRSGNTPSEACQFYYKYKEDIALIKEMGIPNFRFSISWSRILPNGIGEVNDTGIAFYHSVIDECLKNNITPWITLYHWDLPQLLEDQGGWTNRNIVNWFNEFVSVCIRSYHKKVKHWMVLNEPMVFTGAGYFLGVHAPGKKGVANFLKAMHHAVLCQAQGLKTIKAIDASLKVGTTYSCSYLTPNTRSNKDINATKRMDALLNRSFIEPALGLGYPLETLPFLKKIEKYMLPGDEALMTADFDFIGIQNYTREVVTHSYFIPFLNAKLIPASKRKVYHTAMDWEVYPESIYQMIKQFGRHKGVKEIYITENGASFPDKLENSSIDDHQRTQFLETYLKEVQRSKQEGSKVKGYFVWSLTDNFEWAEGYHQRFGLVYIDFKTQRRMLKNSGKWYKTFLRSSQS
jgi:beta-glucosidase